MHAHKKAFEQYLLEDVASLSCSTCENCSNIGTDVDMSYVGAHTHSFLSSRHTSDQPVSEWPGITWVYARPRETHVRLTTQPPQSTYIAAIADIGVADESIGGAVARFLVNCSHGVGLVTIAVTISQDDIARGARASDGT